MSAPFVNFRMNPIHTISSTPTLIFGNDQHTCLIDGLVLSNLTDNVILVTLTVARETEVGEETLFVLADEIPIQPFDRVDALFNLALTLEPGDLLYAQSDYSENIFNAFVSYRELTEL